MNDWLQVAMEPAVVRRALKYAFVVGALLITINHGYALWHGDRSLLRFMEMGLTMVVPYCVSTMSSVGAIQEARGEQTNEQPAHARKKADDECTSRT